MFAKLKKGAISKALGEAKKMVDKVKQEIKGAVKADQTKPAAALSAPKPCVDEAPAVVAAQPATTTTNNLQTL